MPLSQLRNVNFGRTRLNATGSSGVGYKILDENGTIVAPRTTSGVYQTAPGIYAAYISFPDGFRGQLLWDTGAAFLTASYATEQYNYEENNPNVDATLNKLTVVSGTVGSIYDTVTSMTGTLNSIYDVQYGRWQIINNQMIFFKEDNSTEVARFDLFDDAGNPTMDSVFERVKV